MGSNKFKKQYLGYHGSVELEKKTKYIHINTHKMANWINTLRTHVASFLENMNSYDIDSVWCTSSRNTKVITDRTRCFECAVVGDVLHTFVVVVGGSFNHIYEMRSKTAANIMSILWANKYNGKLKHFTETLQSRWIDNRSINIWNKSSKIALFHRHTLKSNKIKYLPDTYCKIDIDVILSYTPSVKLSENISFICPITHEIMHDPVICPEGQTFERAAIELWLSTNNSNPLTRNRLTQDMLIPNIALRNAIRY